MQAEWQFRSHLACVPELDAVQLDGAVVQYAIELQPPSVFRLWGSGTVPRNLVAVGSANMSSSLIPLPLPLFPAGREGAGRSSIRPFLTVAPTGGLAKVLEKFHWRHATKEAAGRFVLPNQMSSITPARIRSSCTSPGTSA